MKNKLREPVHLDIMIQITAEAIVKLWTWADLAKGEFSALGTVDEVIDQETGAITALKITDLYLIDQICSESDTELDPAAVSQLMIDIEDPAKLKCWVHSHGDIDVFWSDTDDECIEGLANGTYVLSLVVNKRHRTLMRLDQFHPTHMYISDIAFEVHYPLDDSLKKQYAAEFKKKVKESIFLIPPGNGFQTYDEIEEADYWLDLQEHEEGLIDV